MTVTHIHPAARRLSPTLEERARKLYVEDKMTERQVAKALGVGNGTAHRLRERLGLIGEQRCTGLNAKGRRCGNLAETDGRCQDHLGQEASEVAKPAVPPRIGTRKERLLARRDELTAALAKVDAELDEIIALTDIGDMLEAARLVEPVSETARAIHASHIQVLEDRLADLKRRIPA